MKLLAIIIFLIWKNKDDFTLNLSICFLFNIAWIKFFIPKGLLIKMTFDLCQNVPMVVLGYEKIGDLKL